MPYKGCSEPGCPRHAAPGKSMCPMHAAAQRKQNRSPFNAFYAGKGWAQTRNRQLFDHPLCARCGRVADSVHHIRELTNGGAPRDPANLESLCRRCHSLEHAQRRHRKAA